MSQGLPPPGPQPGTFQTIENEIADVHAQSADDRDAQDALAAIAAIALLNQHEVMGG